MKPADFVHLHNHSDYSLLDGASPIPRMIKRAAELGMPAVALTDHGAMFGAIEFHQEAKKAGLKPIIGMEAYVTRGKRQDRTRETAHHLVLLARDEQGFRNLIRLSSIAFLEGFYYKPRLDHEVLSQYAAGITALSACPKGEIASDLLDGNESGALRTAETYRDIFGDGNFFLEVQNHGLEIEDRIRAGVVALARKTGLPLVATNDCHYLRHEDYSAHDVLLCIQTGKNVSDEKRMRYETDQVYFKTADEMRARFGDLPEALSNTLRVAEMCSLDLKFGKPLLPEFPLPPEWSSADDFLRHLTEEGMRWRFPNGAGESLRQRTHYELDVICRMGFASYFLIVRDFIDFARKSGIGVGPGRGSVAGSLVAYVLRITDIDPIEHGLIFERFLNPERVTMPDIDIDFDDLRRGEVIEYVRRKYGEGSVTQVITFGTMGAKGVVRDVGRALGLAFAEVDKIAKLVPDGLGMTLERALELSPDLKNIGQRGPEFARLLDSARVLEGLARHASTHAAGVLITPGPLTDYVPLYRQKDESVTTQWDMKSIEKAGLLKMDFLGLRTLSMLDECVRLVKQHRGADLDLSKLKLDDAPAYKVFQSADTVAIFQFESSGMRDYLRRLKPSVFGDLTAMNALYRPGPMENIPYFIDCKHGRQVAKFEHPALEPILKDTYGVFVYQEQVMAAAHTLAGFSMAEADELRRAMGKKLQEEMEKKRNQFVEGCGTNNKIAPKVAERIFATMEKFAGYGFNRAHSAAYALLAYQSAFLKAHYPAEFMAATLTSEMSDSARIATLIEECRRMKLEILAPCVNRSEWKFTIEDGRIRYAMGAVRNVGQSAVESIVAARRDGAFHDLFELASRLDSKAVNRRVLESLVAAGACDALGPERGQLFAASAVALDQAAVLQREKQSGQSSLFGDPGGPAVAVAAPRLPFAAAWTPKERTSREKEALGFFLSDHPMAPLREQLASVASHDIASLAGAPDGAEVRVAALIGEIKAIVTKSGKRMAALQLEDLGGRIEATLFPDVYEAARPHLVVDAIVVVHARVESNDRGFKLLAGEIMPWDSARATYRPSLHIEIRADEITEAWLQSVDTILNSHRGDSDVYLHIVKPDGSREATRARRYRVAEGDAVLRALVGAWPALRVRWAKETA